MIRRMLFVSCLLVGIPAAKALQATVAHSVFYQKQPGAAGKYDANVTLCWRASTSSMHFEKDSANALYATVVVLLRISSDSGIHKEETFRWVTPHIADGAAAMQQLIIDQYSYTLAPGHYQAELVLYEPSDKDHSFQYTDTFSIDKAAEQKPFLSGILLLDTFFRSDAKTIFSRNGSIQIPLATDYIGERQNNLKYFVEVYEAATALPAQQPLKLRTFISFKPFAATYTSLEKTDSLDQTVYTAYTGAFPVDILISGNYYLNAQLTDRNDQVLDKKCIFLQRYNTAPKHISTTAAATKVKKDTTAEPHVLDLTSTFVAKFTPQQVREVMHMLLLIAEPDEGLAIQGFLKKPDEFYSKYFIYNFWEKRNKQDPGKAWKEYANRIREVNRLFGGGSRPGYATDRGRLYIQYGKPNDRIQVPNESGALPYEVWQYFRLEKTGKEALFLLYRSGSSAREYELLHSTVIGEKRNMNWRALLYGNSITNAGMNNPDSQAEQYIGNK